METENCFFHQKNTLKCLKINKYGCLADEDKITRAEIILLRAGESYTENMDLTCYSICDHHFKFFVYKYSLNFKYCINIFNNHSNKISSNSREVTLEKSRQIKSRLDLDIRPGHRLCKKCRSFISNEIKTLNKREKELERSLSSEDEIEDKNEDHVVTPYTESPDASTSISEVANESAKRKLRTLGVEVPHFHQANSQSREKRIKNSFISAQKSLAQSMSQSFGVNEIKLLPESLTEKNKIDLKSFYFLMDSLKKRLNEISCREEKLKLLTIVPEYWTVNETANFFNVTPYMYTIGMYMYILHV